MAASSSKAVIFAALIGNGLIAITKFGAALITGSSAMLSEGIASPDVKRIFIEAEERQRTPTTPEKA